MTRSEASDAGPLDVALLLPALEAARRALRQMKGQDIPPALRNLAARSGRLPPPLASRLLQALNGSEWLRAESVAAWKDIDPDDPDAKRRASAAFLQRPEGWEALVRSLADETAETAAIRTEHKLAENLAKAERRIERLESMLAGAEERVRRSEASVAERLKEQADRLGRSQARELLEFEQLQRMVGDLEERLVEVIAQRDVLAKDVLSPPSRSVTPPPPFSSTHRPGAWEFGTPVELARHLDDLVAAGVMPPAEIANPPGAIRSGTLRLPPGLAPDRAEAIYWLLDQPVAMMVAIDGWNAAHLLRSPPDLEARGRIVEAGRRLAAASVGKRRVIVIFDSRAGNEHHRYPEVEVRFVASADEGILELARTTEAPLVVVTSDRRVREGAEAMGAVGLWSQAVVDWLQTGGRRTFRA
jgi:hypothetical protein